MYRQGISSNIMSLGGIAIAIGAMVDAVIIMIENAHKHLERDAGKKAHWQIIRDASVEVGPALFYSLLVITVSFIPVFSLEAQEGRLFKPLAFTKTYSMAAAALLSITLAPILMGYFIRGKILPEEKSPINRLLIWIYHPVIDFVIRWRWMVIIAAGVIVVWVFFPWNLLVTERLPEGKLKDFAATLGKAFPFQNLGSEFMPPLYEGDLLYMPTTFPGISATKARELIQVSAFIVVDNANGADYAIQRAASYFRSTHAHDLYRHRINRNHRGILRAFVNRHHIHTHAVLARRLADLPEHHPGFVVFDLARACSRGLGWSGLTRGFFPRIDGRRRGVLSAFVNRHHIRAHTILARCLAGLTGHHRGFVILNLTGVWSTGLSRRLACRHLIRVSFGASICSLF
jgi:hypothetical protein